MLDPADCGPAFIALPQDVQAEAYDYPAAFFEPRCTTIARPRPDRGQLPPPPTLLRAAERPLIIAGGGVHYSLAEASWRAFAERHGIPVVETVAGKSTLAADHPCYAGPIGVIGAEGANALAAEADVVVAVGTRLQDFATGSWSVFGDDRCRIIGVNAARFDAKQAPRPAGGRRRPRALVELDAAARRLARAGGVDGAASRPEVATLWEYLDRIARAAARAARADLRPGRRRRQRASASRTTTR